LVAASTGCGKRLQKVLLPESRPEIRLTRERLASPTQDSYAWLARWSGSGMPVDHYVYAIDPTAVDAVDSRWLSTTDTQLKLEFPGQKAAGVRDRPHVFAIRAVGPDGAVSDPAWFAFAQSNIPPSVQITSPNPSTAFTPNLPPDFTFRWTGHDPDGSTQMPVKYKFRLFGEHNPDFPAIPDFISFALARPDSFMSLYAPGFAGWDSVPGESTSVRITGMHVGSNYLFAITAFDEVGDYDPVFQNGRNMLKFGVTFPGTFGPLLRMYNQFFDYTYPTGGYFNDAAHTVPIEMPAGQSLTVNWVAEAPPGANIHWYRWVLAPLDLLDETPRTNEATDVHHWSARSLSTTSATLGPFSPPPGRTLSQLLYIEVEDDYGFRSLGIVDIIVHQSVITGELLFVDDTRLLPDLSTAGGGVVAPSGPWPTAAELDTFLFARGGYPWRGYPAGTVSPPGIFNGYPYDTLGTRRIPGGTPPLSLLASYSHVVWYTDETSATYTAPPDNGGAPITALRLISSPGSVSSPLAAYVLQGGKVWLCGGGAAYATLIAWNKPNTSPSDYNSLEPNPELRPGRFMYDFAHWREGVQMFPAIDARKFGSTSFGAGTNRPGRHWPPSPPPPTPPSPPDYSLLPANLDPKNSATDPPPPLRQPDTFWLRTNYNAEYISRPTLIRDYNDGPMSLTRPAFTPRTALLNSPVYHGRDRAVVFSGPTSGRRRTECLQLVDWVLQSVWGIPRDAGAPRTPGAVSVSAVGIPPAAGRVAARPAVSRGGVRQ
jgi:hypothetical protein